ncbi:MAG TPA: zf-HC2 domain-containing protein [Solirubrobacter sp.]
MTFSLRRAPRHVACIEFVELVTDYLEGVLPDRERRALEHHLSLCDPCVAYLAQMRETRRLTGTLQVDDVPEAGVEDLMAVFRAYHAERTDEPGG